MRCRKDMRVRVCVCVGECEQKDFEVQCAQGIIAASTTTKHQHNETDNTEAFNLVSLSSHSFYFIVVCTVQSSRCLNCQYISSASEIKVALIDRETDIFVVVVHIVFMGFSRSHLCC